MIPLGVLGSARFAGGGPATLDFLQGTSSATGSSSTHTFTSQNLGAADAARTIIVAVVTQAPITSVTVGGVTASLDVVHAGGSSSAARIGRATVPTGTTGNVVVTLSAATDRVGIGLWRVGAALTVVETGTPLTDTILAVNSGDFIVAARFATATSTWSNVTKQWDLAVAGVVHSGASAVAASTGNVTVSATPGSFALATAAYRV